MSKRKFDMRKHLSALLRDEPFFSYISLQVDKVSDTSVPTCGVRFNESTSRFQLLYNEEFVNSLPAKEILGVLKHEFYHLIFNHVTAEKRVNHKVWNIAADLAINSHLIGELPDIACFPGEGPFENMPIGKTSEWYYQAILSQMSEEDVDGVSEMDSHEEWSPANGDTPGDTKASVGSEIANSKLQDAISKAVSDCSKTNRWGTITAEMKNKLIDKYTGARVSWQKVLRYFCKTSQRMEKNSTVRKINKRFPYMFPAKKVRRVAKIALSLDQSGSVDDKMLAEFFSEINVLSSIVDFDLIPFDTRVHEDKIVRVKKGQNIKRERVLTGGTCFDAPTKYVNEHNYDAHIVVTDLGAPTPGRSTCKRLWIAPKRVMSYTNFKCGNEKVLGI
jgi:predicted metal-dependent peptidase